MALLKQIHQSIRVARVVFYACECVLALLHHGVTANLAACVAARTDDHNYAPSMDVTSAPLRL